MGSADQEQKRLGYRLKSAQFHLFRRLLHAWIRPTVLRADADILGLGPDDHVVYVMALKSTADLMVTDFACERAGLPRPYQGIIDMEARAFFFLARPEGRLGRRSPRLQSERMHRLFDHAAAGRGPIKIVPVSLFWGHQPDREKSLFKYLFSENWTTTTRLKKFLAMLFYPNHILVQFGPTLSLNELVDEPIPRERQVRKLMRILRARFTAEKQAILGPDLSHRRTLINAIMRSRSVTLAIQREATADNESMDTVNAKALSYANEIVSDQSYRVIRFFHVLLSWLWNKLYDGIDVHHVEIPKALASNHEVVYIPCHRSHIDYLLLSFVLYHNGLTPPHIAAGKNLNLPIVGTLLRRAGAFFMRRSFQGDALYKAVFDEYLHLMFSKGYSVEYFIEGGRSRTGRMLTPRTGMLSMTMRSFQRDTTRPMALLPVHFSYERVLEAPTYMSELAGRDKKQESFFDIFRIFRAFKHSFGKVAVSFGRPVILAEFLDHHLPEWQEDQGDTSAFSDACIQLSRELATRINDAAVVNPVNLVATALLSSPRQVMGSARLQNQIDVLRELARIVPNLTVTALPSEAIVTTAEQVAGVERQETGGLELISVDKDTTVLLTYYRNSTAHVFALPSMISRIICTFEQVDIERIIELCRQLYPYFQAEYFLRWQEPALDEVIGQMIEKLDDLGLIVVTGDTVSIPPFESESFAALSELAQIIQPTLERFFVVNQLLVTLSNASVREVEAAAAATGRQLSMIYGINAPDFFEQSLFSTYIVTLRSRNVISVTGEAVVTATDFDGIATATATTLDPGVRYNVLHVAGKLASEKNLQAVGA